MADPVSFDIRDGVATLTMDDGKANALAPAMSAGLNAGLDRAGKESAKAILIGGRPGVLCGGFDLKIIRGDDDALRTSMRDAGMALLTRLYLSPIPIVFACTGHAVAAGALLLLTGDVRIGIRGDFRIGLNETAIGLALPVGGLELARDRLAPEALTAATVLARLYDPDGAAEVGYLDKVVAADDLDAASAEAVGVLANLDGSAFAETKRRLRAPTLDRIAAAG